MFTKTEIFKDIQNVLRYDYAGNQDKIKINRPENYTVKDEMSDKDFEEIIQSYLLDFNDGHLWFTSKNRNESNLGFKTRRYKDAIYVTHTTQEKGVEAGDKIIKIDDDSIPQLEKIYHKQLEEEDNERQQWQYVLRKAEKILFERDGRHFELELSRYDADPYESEYVFKQMDDTTAYLKITDFAEGKPIRDLLENNKEAIKQTRNLIIDVRVNYGGNDEFYFPILDHVFDRRVAFKDLFDKGETMYTNYTERNCRLWIEELEEYLQQDLDDYSKNSIKDEIEGFQNHRGEGFLEVPEESGFLIEGDNTPESVYVLTDYYCGSSGDTFVANVKKSNKVTVVGRPTMGIMNYFNVVTVDYGEYEFVYSISKMEGFSSFGDSSGVKPDIHIPWTPGHLKHDGELEYVFKLIEDKSAQ